MFAIIKTGGKQYKVAKDNLIKIETLDLEVNGQVEFDNVLLIADQDKVLEVGSPIIEGAKVIAEVVKHARDPKIIIFKKKRRKNYRRKTGHRQNVTFVRILEIKRKA
jgi:large subunit ribosomal protein L21